MKRLQPLLPTEHCCHLPCNGWQVWSRAVFFLLPAACCRYRLSGGLALMPHIRLFELICGAGWRWQTWWQVLTLKRNIFGRIQLNIATGCMFTFDLLDKHFPFHTCISVVYFAPTWFCSKLECVISWNTTNLFFAERKLDLLLLFAQLLL